MNNKRTKESLVRVGKTIVCTCYFEVSYRQHREIEEFFVWAVIGGIGVNGLM